MNIFKRIAWQIREWRGLRICNTKAEFEAYCKVLGTPAKIAFWIDGNVAYDHNELPLRWRSVEDILGNRNEQGFQYGNCTEMACLARVGLRAICYKADIVVMRGEDPNHKRVAHAFALYSAPGVRGMINSPQQEEYPADTPWQKIAVLASPCDKWSCTTFNWTNEKGKDIVGCL